MINWLVYNKNDIVVADVESEEEALEVVQDLTEDPWWKDEAPYRIEMLPVAMKHSTVVKETEDGELYIDLSDELMEKMGWDIDTELVWTVYDDGKIGLRKRSDD